MLLLNFLLAHRGNTEGRGWRKTLSLNIKPVSLPLAQKPPGAGDNPNYTPLQGALWLLLLSQKLPVDAFASRSPNRMFEPSSVNDSVVQCLLRWVFVPPAWAMLNLSPGRESVLSHGLWS